MCDPSIMAAKYSYNPFLSSKQSMWLLLLQPAKDRTAPLRCSLEQVSLVGAKHSYKALSYVWGALSGSQPLLCNEHVILITPICESALRHLRHAREPVTLWVDSVCIDQTNVEEHAHQVSLMVPIYENAEEVVIWLGEGTPRIHKCFARMKTLVAVSRSSTMQNAWKRSGWLGAKVFALCSKLTPALLSIMGNPSLTH
jgi:hypothetical protein